ncbi:MAG: S8 family serine peptidase [Bacteroidetes bacterium]|nr:S8 family serine peptidase [Bacteroidota bacterium]
MNKYILGCFIFLIFGLEGSAQTGNRYWIEFTDKSGSPFRLDQPGAYLSARSIERRQKQGIAIDSTDLPVNPAYLEALRLAGAVVRHTSKWLNGATIEAPDSPTLARVQGLPFVRSIRKNGRSAPHNEHPRPSKLAWNGQQEGVPRLSADSGQYGAGWEQLALHKGEWLHNRGFRGEGVWIAVFDAGFVEVDRLSCFDSLRLGNRIADTWDFVDLSPNPFGFDAHGTYVMGCLAAWWPGRLVGTAPGATYLLYRTENNVGGSENQIEEDNWVAAAERADSAGADIFNTSLAYSTFDDPLMDHSYNDMDGQTARITRGSDFAASKGILVVASAGNYGNSAWRYIAAPADGDSVLAVGAVARNRNRVAFSSQGPTADGRIKPNVMAVGSGAASCDLTGQDVAYVSGTSFSGPIMAGLAACLWQSRPHARSMHVFKALEMSADRSASPDTFFGHGIPDVSRAWKMLPSATTNQPSVALVYPNPCTEEVVVEFPWNGSDQNDHLAAFDAMGRACSHFRYTAQFFPNEQRVSIFIEFDPNMRAGLYVFNWTTSDAGQSFRIIKN